MAGRTGVPLRCHRVGPPGVGADLVPEPGVNWAADHDIATDGAVLVRPDGFVGWRARVAARHPERTLTEALRELLRRT
ncbi:hypothetical protein NKH77_41710 [Streptomyces sp. M19]